MLLYTVDQAQVNVNNFISIFKKLCRYVMVIVYMLFFRTLFIAYIIVFMYPYSIQALRPWTNPIMIR